MTSDQRSIVELSEAIKELVRIIRCFPNASNLQDGVQRRLDIVYGKAAIAKDRVEVQNGN